MEKDRYFERFNFPLADVYRSLSHFSKISTEFQRYLNSQISTKYGRNTSPGQLSQGFYSLVLLETRKTSKHGCPREDVHAGFAAEAGRHGDF